MKLYKSILFLVPVLIFAGCSHFTSPARKHEINEGRYWLDYDASRRGAFFINYGNTIKTCAEPSPDVAYKLTEKLKASVTYGGATGTGEGDFNQDVVKLAERTQMIMFLREALFRLCELSLNTNISAEKHVGLFKEVLATSSNITETEKIEATAKLERIRKGKFTNDDSGVRLRKFWLPDGKTVNKENEKILKEWIKKNIDGPASIPLFLSSNEFIKERLRAVKELNL